MSKINSRKKGVVYEQKIAREMRDLGFRDCVTSRAESKNLDDAGVDLCYTDPFNIQLKAVERFGTHHEVLRSMPNDSNINVVFHKRNNKGTVVMMTKDDFYALITGYMGFLLD